MRIPQKERSFLFMKKFAVLAILGAAAAGAAAVCAKIIKTAEHRRSLSILNVHADAKRKKRPKKQNRHSRTKA